MKASLKKLHNSLFIILDNLNINRLIFDLPMCTIISSAHPPKTYTGLYYPISIYQTVCADQSELMLFAYSGWADEKIANINRSKIGRLMFK